MSSEDLRSQLDGLFSDVVLDLEAEKGEAVVGPTEAEMAERQRREVPPASVLAREAKRREERARVIEIGLYILLIILVIIVAVALGVVLLRLARRAMSLDIYFREDIFNVLMALGMADVGQAWQNGYAERLIRTIKEEEVDLSEYIDYNDAYRQLGRFLDDVYMHKRIHSSLGYLTPAEFEEQWRKEQALALDLN